MEGGRPAGRWASLSRWAIQHPNTPCFFPHPAQGRLDNKQTVLGGHPESFLPRVSSSPPRFLPQRSRMQSSHFPRFIAHSPRTATSKRYHHPDTRAFLLPDPPPHSSLFNSCPLISKNSSPCVFFFLCAFQLCTRQIKVDMFLKDLMTQQYQRQRKLYIWDYDWNFKKMVKPIKIPKHSQKILKFLLLILSTSTPFFGHGQL